MIDMEMGNLQSVWEAFQRIGAQVRVTSRAEEVERAEAVILPGVGAFGDGMVNLREKGLVEPLRRHALEKKKPLFGICIGMQLLAEEGEEHGSNQGLGLIKGRVVRLRPTDEGCRVPNMGWCDVVVENRQSLLFADLPGGDAFYFAHSYHMQCANSEDVAASIDYSGRLAAAVERDNIYGVQFHPEKSQDAGLQVLASFVKRLRQTGLA
jgi:glutamine amidotransferase